MGPRGQRVVGLLLLLGTIAVGAAVLAQDAPAPGKTLKAGDDVFVSFRVRVQADGSISLPRVDSVTAAGLSIDGLRAALAALPGLDGAGVEVRPAARTVTVACGAVQKTIDVPVDRNMRILEVLVLAGTFDDASADLSHVSIRRAGMSGRTFEFTADVADIVERGREQENVIVFEGDLLIVPQRERVEPAASDWVYVLGAVGRPGRQPILKGRTPFTLTKLIALCGDFGRAAGRMVRVIRVTPSGRETIDVDFDDILEGRRPDFELHADDVVIVPERK